MSKTNGKARSQKVLEGRSANGRFKKGEWKGGPGNPYGHRREEYRKAVLAATSAQDVVKVWLGLQAKALEQEPWAVKEYLERTLGKEVAAAILASEPETLIKVINGIDYSRV